MLAAITTAGGSAWAYPDGGPQAVCEVYPWTAQCNGRLASCLVCHTAPPALNPFGKATQQALRANPTAGMAGALVTVQNGDADGDGTSNLHEFALGTHPGDILSKHVPVAPSEEALSSSAYSVGSYDPVFALRRLKVAFCGVGPSYDEVEALRTAADPAAMLHTTLDACLKSGYWRDEAIVRLADSRIRPITSLSNCLNMMANFEHDYDLFAYIMTGGRDARDLLLADYHVSRGADGTLTIIDEQLQPIESPATRAGITCSDPFGNSPPIPGSQPVPAARRAGLLSTQWFMTINTQASWLPRTTAALAYKAWLGYDISSYEGLYPDAGMPADYDERGVQVPPCVHCHTTLDPLAYAFAYYNGVAPPFGADAGENGGYERDRPTTSFQAAPAWRDAWAADPPLPYALGTELSAETATGDGSSLVEVAEEMAASSEFARHIVEMVFAEVTGTPPQPGHHDDMNRLIMAFTQGGYSVDALAHALIDTNAFGAP